MRPALQLMSVLKDYRALRPLRVRELTVGEGEVVALDGLDAAGAEVLTNLVTGAALPDEGSVRVFGQETAAIVDADDWLAGLDRFGILSDRVALVEGFTLRQNIAVALTLELEPMSGDVRAAAGTLAAEVGLAPDLLDGVCGAAPPAARLRARLARAIALSPKILLAEHPTASILPADLPVVVADFFRVVRRRHLSVLIVTVDSHLGIQSDRHLVLEPGTGAVKRHRKRGWFF